MLTPDTATLQQCALADAADADSAITRIQSWLAAFEPISLADMNHVSLLDRTETKYVLGASQLRAVLAGVAGRYRVLCTDHGCLHHYRNLYFDTDDFAMYHQHHNGARSRYKVRARQYVDHAAAFLEVKDKTNKNRTVKSRLRIPGITPCIVGEACALVDGHTPFRAADLEPTLWNEYLRCTLVSQRHPERVTVDVNLKLGWQNDFYALPGLIIVEVKQERFSMGSDIMQQLRRWGVRSSSFSKYCLGICMVHDTVKSNRFKPQLRRVNKLICEESAHESAH